MEFLLFCRRKKKSDRWKQRPLANIGYLLLIISVYFFTVVLKYGPEWRKEFSAVYYALSLDQLRLYPVGEWLWHKPSIMRVLTFMTLLAEILIPLLIIMPSKKGVLRLIAFFLVLFLHLGIGLTLYVGLFFIINIVTAIGLIPGFVFDKLEKKLHFLHFLAHSSVLRKVPFREKRNRFLSRAGNIVCLTTIVFSMIINFSGVYWFRYELQNGITVVVNAVRFDQYWGMFSPNVLKRDGWYVYYGMDSLGRQWDLAQNADHVSFDKPDQVLQIHKTDRWRKLTENLQREDMLFLRPFFCRYKLKEWNKKHPEKRMNSLMLYYMQSETLPHYKRTPVQKVLLCVCSND
jgi:hypothetical protein